MKRLIAIVLALVTVLSLCAACSKGGSGDKDSGKDGKNVTLTIGLPANALITDFDNNALTKYLEEKTGYNLEFVPYSGGSEIATQISTAVVAGHKLPDIIWDVTLGDDVVDRYGDDGYFLDLQDYFADKDGASKTFWDRLATLDEDQQNEVVQKMTNVETGAIYAVPSVEYSMIDTMDYQMWINTTWLDKLNLEMPTNPDELYTVLKAFKENDCNGNGNANDELPLFGSQEAGLGADVISWLINMFVYFNDRRVGNVDENGKIYPVYTTDAYREAMIYINKLYKEKLITDSVFSAKTTDMATITTPSSGTALCGIFAGHLRLHVNAKSDLLDQYEAMPMFGNVVINSNTNRRNVYITADCENPDEAFNLLMTMWSEEASLRIRYGEYGVNWTEADEGAKSAMGLDATIKIIDDPFSKQTSVLWGNCAGTLNYCSEGETAQIDPNISPEELRLSQMHAESYKLHAEGAEKNNPKTLCPILYFTEEEEEAAEFIINEVQNIFGKYRSDFCLNKKDPNDDKVWNQYLKELEDAQLDTYMALCQKAYDRQMAAK